MQQTKTIPPSKRYAFPPNIDVVHYADKILVISPETANWIVLDNNQQLDFLRLLETHTLGQALDLFKGEFSDAQNVVIQLEARHFENMEVLPNATALTMHIYLTNACNLRCAHCYMFSGDKMENELTTEELKAFLQQFCEHDGESINLSGGEISMRSDLYEIVQYAFGIGLRVELMTNGTLWTPALVHKVAPYIANVQISIDGYSEEENAKQRGKGNFQKALSTVELFLNAKVPVNVAVTPFFDDNLETKYKAYLDFATSLLEKYKNAPAKLDILMGDSLLDGRDLSATEEVNNRYSTFCTQLYSEIQNDNGDSVFIDFHRKMGIEDNCAFGHLVLAANGDMYFCANTALLKPFANIRTHSFEDILALSNQAKKYSNIVNMEPCRTCSIKYICGGGGCRLKDFEGFTEGLTGKDITPRRICTDKIKNHFYEQMIRTNTAIFT